MDRRRFQGCRAIEGRQIKASLVPSSAHACRWRGMERDCGTSFCYTGTHDMPPAVMRAFSMLSLAASGVATHAPSSSSALQAMYAPRGDLSVR